MKLRKKRNRKLVYFTAVVVLALIAVAGNQPIIAYYLG